MATGGENAGGQSSAGGTPAGGDLGTGGAPDLQVAAGFASSRAPLLFVINTDASFMQRGVAMQWLSTAPFELEYLLPPCTYLEPTGRKQVIELRAGIADGVQGQERCTVVEVVPQM